MPMYILYHYCKELPTSKTLKRRQWTRRMCNVCSHSFGVYNVQCVCSHSFCVCNVQCVRSHSFCVCNVQCVHSHSFCECNVQWILGVYPASPMSLLLWAGQGVEGANQTPNTRPNPNAGTLVRPGPQNALDHHQK